MSNLSTLLEAARFVEMQELKEQQHRAAVEAALAASSKAAILPSSSTSSSIRTTSPLSQHHKTVVITTSDISSSSSTAGATIGGTVVHHQQRPLTLSSATINCSNSNNSSNNNSKKDQPEQQQIVTSTSVHNNNNNNNNNNNSSNNNNNNNNNRHRVLHNSFDIMNPLVIDEANGLVSESKRRQVPIVFRAGTREVHNKLEKHRRAHLKECFDVLKNQLPATQDEKKTSNLSILHSALRYIQTLKRKERELEHEMERLARDKISAQHRLALLKKDITSHFDNVDFSKILPDVIITNNNTSTNNETLVTLNETNTTITTTTTTVPPIVHQEIKIETTNNTQQQQQHQQNGAERIPIPLLPNKSQLATAISSSQIKEVSQQQQQPLQTTALSVLPVGYPVSQGLVLQKVAIVPKGLTDLTPLMSTHFITPQQLNGKVVPLVNAQYVVKPVVVVSTASPRPS